MKAENKDLLLPRTVFEASADRDIELENTLADYLPNINRVIRVTAEVLCEEVRVSGDKAEVSGKAAFALLYESDFKQKLQCEKFETDFTHKFDLKELPDGELMPTARARCSYVGCKTLNPRRFILRCRAALSLEVRCMQAVQTVSMGDTEGAYFKSEKRVLAVYEPCVVRDFGIEESVALDTLPPVNEVVCASLCFSPCEISLSAGSAALRAEALFRCLYETEGEDYALQLASRRFPVSFTVDDDCIGEDSEARCTLRVRNIDAEKDIDAYGENRVIKLRCSVRAELCCVNRREEEVPTDMFFEDYESENKCSELPYEEPAKELRHRFGFEKVFDLPETAPESCTDANADISISEAVLTDGGILVKGSCAVNVLGKAGGEYRAHDCAAPFAETVPFSAACPDCRVAVTGDAQSVSAEIAGGRLSVRVPVQLSVCVTYREKLPALVSAEIEKRAAVAETGAKPLIIYYPQKGETAWEIGKRYYVNPAAIVENNAEAFDKSGKVASDGVVLYL